MASRLRGSMPRVDTSLGRGEFINEQTHFQGGVTKHFFLFLPNVLRSWEGDHYTNSGSAREMEKMTEKRGDTYRDSTKNEHRVETIAPHLVPVNPNRRDHSSKERGRGRDFRQGSATLD